MVDIPIYHHFEPSIVLKVFFQSFQVDLKLVGPAPILLEDEQHHFSSRIKELRFGLGPSKAHELQPKQNFRKKLKITEIFVTLEQSCETTSCWLLNSCFCQFYEHFQPDSRPFSKTKLFYLVTTCCNLGQFAMRFRNCFELSKVICESHCLMIWILMKVKI